MRRRFDTPLASGKVGNWPRYNPLAFLGFPFIRKGTRRKYVSGVLDGDIAIPLSLNEPLRELVSDRPYSYEKEYATSWSLSGTEPGGEMVTCPSWRVRI